MGVFKNEYAALCYSRNMAARDIIEMRKTIGEYSQDYYKALTTIKQQLFLLPSVLTFNEVDKLFEDITAYVLALERYKRKADELYATTCAIHHLHDKGQDD